MVAWARLFHLLKPSYTKTRMALSMLVGLLTGVAGWLFIRLIERVQFWPAIPHESALFGHPLNAFWLVTIPGIGGLLCGLVVQYLAPSVKGTGTADIMYALRRKRGHISGKHTFYKAIGSIFTVCSGGAAGPEGPVVAFGAGLGSWIGSWRALEPADRVNLVVAGAAAGFAAVFNAPIAAVLFAIEVLLKEFASQAFMSVILATVTASITTRLLLGNRVFVEVPATFTLKHTYEMGFYVVLGVLAAIGAKAFVQIYFAIEHLFDRWKRAPQAVKAMIGGLLLGLLALVLPAVLGNGHSEIPRLITDESVLPWLWTTMLFLLIGKMVACPLTLGSGGSGGIFIPFLFMGALLGGLAGRVIHLGFPDAAPVGAYMLVGMGAMFAGITYAPFTSIILLFELTHDYNIILPLMFTVGVTLVVTRSLDPESLDSHKLLKRGVRLHETLELRALEKYRVEDVMSPRVVTIPSKMSLKKITEFIAQHPHTGYPVVDDAGKLVGLVTYTELHQTFNVETLPEEGIVAADIMRSRVPTVHPEDTLTEAVGRMQQDQVDRVMVTDPATGTIAGILTKGDILSIYRKLLTNHR